MKLCQHLEQILTSELVRGNKIRNIDENAWTNAIIVVNLEKQIDVNSSDQIEKKYKFVSYFEVNDNHYELQNGYFCEQCKHSIVGPK